MNCREFVEVLMAYLDGELSAEQVAAFRQHIDACPPCVDYLDTYQATVQLGQQVCRDPEGPIPDDVPEGLVAAVLAARAKA